MGDGGPTRGSGRERQPQMLGDELITLMSEDGAWEVCELLWVRVTQLVGGPSRGALTQGRASGQPFCRGPPARPSHACAHSQLPWGGAC